MRTTFPQTFRDFAYFFAALLLSSVASTAATKLFESGFSPNSAVSTDQKDLNGVDSVTGFDWDSYTGWIEKNSFQYGGDNDPLYQKAEIITTAGPYGNQTELLHFENIEDKAGGSNGRVEFSWFGNDAPNEFEQAYVRYWMKIKSDTGSSTGFPFYMVMEWKEPDDGVSSSGTNNWRSNINIIRGPSGSTYHWQLKNQQVQPVRVDELILSNLDVEVPAFGEWFYVEFFFKKASSNGRIYFAVNGETVFDWTGRTQHATNPLKMKFWSPMKCYVADSHRNLGPREHWYDDFEMWDDFPPDAGCPPGGCGAAIYEQDFNGLSGSLDSGNKLNGFWFEGAASGASAQFANNRLELTADGGDVGTIWLDQVFSGDIKVEFDVHVTGSTGNQNNMNFFLLFSDKSGTPLYDTRSTRSDGDYAKYHGGNDSNHDLEGYILTHLANGTPNNPRYRVRSTPPFDPFMKEVTGVLDATVGTTYHVEIDKIGDNIRYWVNGTLVYDQVDDNSDGKNNPVRDSGLIGFRTWSTNLWWDNLKVSRIGAGSGSANLALNKTVVDVSAGSQTGNGPENALDGDLTNRWSIQNYPKYMTIDLEETYSFDEIKVYPHSSRAYQYTVAVSSTSNGPWTTIVDRSSNTEELTVLADTVTSSATGRYVKIEVTGCTGSNCNVDNWISLHEIEVFGSQSAPSAINDSYTVDQGGFINEPAPGVLGNDTDPQSDPLTAVKVTDPANGTVTLGADGSFTYTPNSGFNGSDSFSYKANDGVNDSNTASVSITVNPPTELASGKSIADVSAGSETGNGPENMFDGDIGTRWSIQNFPKYATVDLADSYNFTEVKVYPLNNRAYQYTVAVSSSSTGPWTTIVDRSGNTEEASVLIDTVTSSVTGRYVKVEVTGCTGSNCSSSNWISLTEMEVIGVPAPPNAAPVALADSYVATEDTTLNISAPGILSNDSDANSDPLTAIKLTNPSHGSLTVLSNGSFTYSPNANYNGPDSFTYKANDGAEDSNTVTVNIDVDAVNDVPVATNDSYNLNENDILDVSVPGVLVNDSDTDSSALTAIKVTDPANGMLTLNSNGSFTYTPDLDYSGTDSFTYKANDGADDSNTATANFTIAALADEIIIDNVDSEFSFVGTWNNSTGAPGYYGSNYRHDANSGADPSENATWTPDVTNAGIYRIEMNWAANSNRPNAAPVVVSYDGGSNTANLTVNQTMDGGVWNDLGDYFLDAGTSNYVRITGADAGYTVADAVRFTLLESSVIEEDFSGSLSNWTSVTGGTWSISGGGLDLASPANASPLGNIITHNTTVNGDFNLEADCSVDNLSAWDDFAVIFSYQDSDNYYAVLLNEQNDPDTSGLFVNENGEMTELADITSAIAGGTTHTIRIEKSSSSITVKLDGITVATATDSTFASGKVGFGSKNNESYFDNLRVTN